MRKKNNVLTLFFLTALFLLQSALPARADTLFTRDGRAWKGLIVAENPQEIWFDLGFDIAVFEKKKIIRTQRSTAKEVNLIRQDLKTKRQLRNHLLRQRDDRPQEVPLINFKGHILVDTILNGRVKARLLLDTGSSLTFLSPKTAERLGILSTAAEKTAEVMTSDGRKQKMAMASLKSIRIASVEAHNVQIAVLPQSTNEITFVDGLLGVSFLARFNFKIDYRRNRLILERNSIDSSQISGYKVNKPNM